MLPRWASTASLYKENVDDVREFRRCSCSESMEEHLCGAPMKVYDPLVVDDVAPNQFTPWRSSSMGWRW